MSNSTDCPKILHLAHDEQFVDMGMRAFDAALPGSNDLYLFSEESPKFVKWLPIRTLTRADLRTLGVNSDVGVYDLVIVHSLLPVWWNFLLKLKVDIPVLWLGWGYDYYDLITDGDRRFVLPLTTKYLAKSSIREFLKAASPCVLLRLGKRVSGWRLGNKRHVIERINYFSPVLPEEHALIRQQGNWRRFPELVVWNYGSLEDDFLRGFADEWVSGNNILLGNSATPTNNHMDALECLATYRLSQRQILVPLSYGGNKYRDAVINFGSKTIGSGFVPLVEFMPIQDYVRLISSCGFVIMNHVRQQALGNIVIMLHMGAKIFLRDENPVSRFLRREGAVVFSIQELEGNVGLLDRGLTESEMECNRRVVRRNWSREASDRKTSQVVEKIFSVGCSVPVISG